MPVGGRLHGFRAPQFHRTVPRQSLRLQNNHPRGCWRLYERIRTLLHFYSNLLHFSVWNWASGARTGYNYIIYRWLFFNYEYVARLWREFEQNS